MPHSTEAGNGTPEEAPIPGESQEPERPVGLLPRILLAAFPFLLLALLIGLDRCGPPG